MSPVLRAPLAAVTVLVAILFLSIVAPARAQTSGLGPVERMAGLGGAVAVLGDASIAIGEPADDRVAGVVHVWRRGADGTWSPAARLSAPDGAPGDGFGAAIAVAGDAIVVGAEPPLGGPGAAYAFVGDVGVRLEPAVAAEGFGAAVAVDGDRALVGAPAADDGAGRVHVFRRAGAAWAPAGTIEPADETVRGFGQSLALAGGRLAVGATAADSAGVVATYRADGDAWRATGALEAAEPAPGDAFGAALALVEGTLLVGAPGAATERGRAYAFATDGDGWTLARAFEAPAPEDGDRFGAAVALTDGEAWFGAPEAALSAGRVLRSTRADGTWSDPAPLGAGDVLRNDRFGAALAVGHGLAVVGAPGDDYGAGTAAVFRREGGDWSVVDVIATESLALEGVTGDAVACADGRASRFPCERVDLLSFLPVTAIGGGRGVEVNDVWGWTDPATGREYAIVGRVDGTAFVDVTDPENPVFVGELPKHAAATGSTWRDIKVYENHAFIVSDRSGNHGMQVFDLTRLREVADPPAVFEPDVRYDRIASAHNIAINEETGFAYTVGNKEGGETCGGGLHMIDISDPRNPTFAGCFADERTGEQRTGYTHDAQCVLYRGPDPDYEGREICFGANETAVSIADVTDKRNPVPIAVAEYPNVAYTHQGWLTEDHRYFYLNDEGDEINDLVERTRTMIWDVADLDDPVMVGEFMGTTQAIDHNLYVKGDRMYQSNYVAGLRIIDISDPENPREIGYFDTVPWGDDTARFDGSWSNFPFFESGTIVVTSGREGLFLLHFRDPAGEPIS